MGSSVFSAELPGILQALSLIYNQDLPSLAVAVVFSDSNAALKAIQSVGSPLPDCIASIWNILACLQSSGTRVTLNLIPSHIGIEGV